MAAAALVVIVAGLRAGAALLVPLAIAALLAITTSPLVAWLEARRVPRWLAVALTLAGLLLALIGPGLVVQAAASQFVAVAPQYGKTLSAMTAEWLPWLEARGVETTQVSGLVNWTALLSVAGGVFTNLALLLSNALLVLLVLAFALMEAASAPALLARVWSADATEAGRIHRVTSEVQHYLRVKTAISLATGVLLGAWTAVLGVDFAVLWGLLAFLLNYVPNVGSLAAAAPPVLLALVQGGPAVAAAVAAGYVAVNLVLGNLIEPYVMGRRLKLSPLVVVLSLVFWGWVWGTPGLVLAVPIIMSLRILCEQSADWRWVARLIAGGERPAPQPPTSAATAAPLP